MFGKKKIEAVSVLDLRNYTPQALRKISSIQAVSTILLPENPSPAFAEAYADITKGTIAARAVCVAIPEDFDLPDRADPITMVEWAQVLGMLGERIRFCSLCGARATAVKRSVWHWVFPALRCVPGCKRCASCCVRCWRTDGCTGGRLMV